MVSSFLFEESRAARWHWLLVGARQLVADADRAFLPVVIWFSARVCVERTTRLSGSKVSERLSTRLRSSSAATCTRARPGPTIPATISSTCCAQAALNAGLLLVEARAVRASSPCAPSARSRPCSSTIEMFSGFSPSTADATRWRMARTWPASSSPRSFRTIEARGGFPVAVEQAPLRDDEVDARGLDPPDGPDRPGELALERAQVVDVLDEARRRERVALVEDLVADAAARRDALAGEVHAECGRARCEAQDGLPVGAGLVGDALRLEVADDGARVLSERSA